MSVGKIKSISTLQVAFLVLSIGVIILIRSFPETSPLAKGILGYFAFLIAPGSILYNELRKSGLVQFSLVSLFVYSNVLGLSLLVAVAWTLSRLSIFSYLSVGAFELILVLVFAFIMSWKRKPDSQIVVFETRVPEICFVIVTFGISMALMLPVFMLLDKGSLIGGDSAGLSYLANIVSRSGHWPILSQVYYPYSSQADVAPGASLVYALFSQLAGINAAYVPDFFSLFILITSTFGMSVLARCFSRSNLLIYGLPIIWFIGTQGGPFLFNSSINYAVSGDSPDSLFGIPLFIIALAILISLLQSKDGTLVYIILLSLVTSATMIFTQLSFFMLVIAIICFGIVVYKLKGALWTITGILILISTLVVLSPPYLVPSEAVSNSPAFGHASASPFFVALGLMGVVDTVGILGVVLALAGLILVVFNYGASPDPMHANSRLIILTLAIVVVLYSIISFTPTGSSLLGIDNFRFIEYLSLVMFPIIVCGLDRFQRVLGTRNVSHRSTRRINADRLLSIGILLVIAVSVYFSIGANATLLQQTTTSGTVFGYWEYQGASWLSMQNGTQAVVVGDLNNGSFNSVFIAPISNHETVVRDRTELYQDIHGVAPPHNQAAIYANLMLTNPNSTNAYQAYTLLHYKYYFLEQPFDDVEIAVFSLLPYVSLVYSNPVVDIFEYTGNSENLSYLIQATSFLSASKGVQAQFNPFALNYATSLPRYPNSISSNCQCGSSFDGNYSTYQVVTPESGNFTIYVHGYFYQLQEYLLISVNEVPVGYIYFKSVGWNFASITNVFLPTGNSTITLTFEGTVGWADPIDYLVIVPS